MKKHYEEQIRELMDKQTKLEKEVLIAEKDKERMKKDLGKLD
jgi:demethoxyubiquinone hydroxylase (CLK1/Coq7/Cat5 family)